MASPKNHGEVPRLFNAWLEGSNGAQAELWPILCDEIKLLVQSASPGQGEGGQNQAVSLIHQAYLNLMGTDIRGSGRRHFFATTARAIRFVLADRAQHQLSQARSRGKNLGLNEPLSKVTDPLDRHPAETLAIHQALLKLAEMHPRHEKIVELRYFAGLSLEETAEVLAIPPHMVVRDWKTVRVWLHGEIPKIA